MRKVVVLLARRQRVQQIQICLAYALIVVLHNSISRIHTLKPRKVNCQLVYKPVLAPQRKKQANVPRPTLIQGYLVPHPALVWKH